MAFFILRCVSKGFPNSPSEYASLAAQTVIGQVLEGVAPLSDDARVQALSITMTAFMEAWMEHILRQKIKFRCVLEHRRCRQNKLMTSLKTAVWYMCVWLFTSHKHRPSSDVDKCPFALFLACRALFSWSRTLTLLEKWSSPTSMVCQLSSTSSCSASGITIWLFLLFIAIFISL